MMSLIHINPFHTQTSGSSKKANHFIFWCFLNNNQNAILELETFVQRSVQGGSFTNSGLGTERLDRALACAYGQHCQ